MLRQRQVLGIRLRGTPEMDLVGCDLRRATHSHRISFSLFVACVSEIALCEDEPEGAYTSLIGEAV